MSLRNPGAKGMKDLKQKGIEKMKKSLNDIVDTLAWVVKELQVVNKVLDTLESRSKRKIKSGPSARRTQ